MRRCILFLHPFLSTIKIAYEEHAMKKSRTLNDSSIQEGGEFDDDARNGQLQRTVANFERVRNLLVEGLNANNGAVY